MNDEQDKKRTCGCSCKRKTAQATPGGATEGGLDRATEYHRIIESFDVLNVPRDIQVLVREALDSKSWDWFTKCDGCTCVSEMYWPTKYFPPCLRHDFDWQTGHGGWEANARFYRIQRAYRMSALQAGTRFVGVTAAWFTWFKWWR
ncbi:MAG: hypothetical protein WCL49_04455 [bacterium]